MEMDIALQHPELQTTQFGKRNELDVKARNFNNELASFRFLRAIAAAMILGIERVASVKRFRYLRVVLTFALIE